MKGHGEKFTRKQETAIVALLTASNMAEAAKQVGIGESTLWRWLQDEVFQKRYREVRTAVFGQAIMQLNIFSCSAVKTLREIACSEDNPASIRVSAAKSILEFAFKAHETEELEWRIKELERAVEEFYPDDIKTKTM